MHADPLANLFRRLLCADLQSVPLLGKRGDASAMFDLDSGDRERSLRMAGLLGFSKNPKREWLLAEMVSKNVGSQARLSHPERCLNSKRAWVT